MSTHIELNNTHGTKVKLINSDTNNLGDTTVDVDVLSLREGSLTTVSTILSLRLMTNTPDKVYVTGYNTANDGAFGSHFFKWNSTSVENDNSGTVIKLFGTTVGRYELQYKEDVQLSWFGADDTGVEDSADLILSALAIGKDTSLGEGTFLSSKKIRVNNQRLYGVSRSKTTIISSHVPAVSDNTGDASLAVLSVDGGGFDSFTLEALVGTGQVGLYSSGTGASNYNIDIKEFENGLRIGETNFSSSYYSDFTNIRVQNDVFKGNTGLRIDGGGAHSSNNNTLHTVTVKGLFDKLYHIKGHNNTIVSCDFSGDRTQGITSFLELTGDGNVIIAPYTEVYGTGAVVNHILFDADSSGNLILRPYISIGVNGIAPITDLGFGNDIQQAAINNGNFLTVPSSQGSQNLHFNSAFQAWNISRPNGYLAPVRGTYTQDNTVVHSGEYSTKFVGDNTGTNALQFRISGASSQTKIPIEFYQGKTIKASCYVHATVAGLFTIKIGSDGTGAATYGGKTHSGSGDWELITASCKVPNDATFVQFQLFSTANSETAYFNAPMINIGGVLAPYVPSIDSTVL